MLVEFLLFLGLILMGIAVFTFLKSAIKARKKISAVSKIMTGFALITVAVMDHVIVSYLQYRGIITTELFALYRFIWELIMGFIGFYFFIEVFYKNKKWSIIGKFLIILLTIMLAEAFLIYFTQDPAVFTDINFFTLLFDFYNTDPQLFLVLGGEKLFQLAGILIFCFGICYIVIKNKFYTFRSKILLTIATLAFIDVVLDIPFIESFGGELVLVYSLWCVAYIFIIFANLTRINFEVLSGVHEILISYKDGRPLYSTGGGKLDAELVTGIISAITSISCEVFHSNQRVRSIDHQDKKILFSYGEFITTSVVIEEESQILFDKADQLTNQFERYFYGILRHWDGNIGSFASAWFIVDEIFPIIEWEHKKSIDEFTENLRKKTRASQC